jgi:Tat protein translocase TatB subunit
MFNVGGGEVLVIMLVALLVIGPTKLPDAARQIGKVLTQVRQMSSGFQRELKSAMDDTIAPPPPVTEQAAETDADTETDTGGAGTGAQGNGAQGDGAQGDGAQGGPAKTGAGDDDPPRP